MAASFSCLTPELCPGGNVSSVKELPALLLTCRALWEALDDHFFEQRSLTFFGPSIAQLFDALDHPRSGYRKFFAQQMQARKRQSTPTFQFRRYVALDHFRFSLEVRHGKIVHDNSILS